MLTDPTTREWAHKMQDVLATIKTSLMPLVAVGTSSFTAFWGWLSDVTPVGLIGMFGTIAVTYFGYCEHRRKQEAHKLLLLKHRKLLVDILPALKDGDS